MAIYSDNYMLGTLVVPLFKGLQSSTQCHRILHNIALQQGTYITAKEVHFIVRLSSSVIFCLDRVLAQYFLNAACLEQIPVRMGSYYP